MIESTLPRCRVDNSSSRHHAANRGVRKIAVRGLVLVVGPDGAGKSTLIDELERQTGQPIARAHSRPGLLAGRRAQGATVTDPHAERPRGHAVSLIKLGVLLVDAVAGTWLRWRPIARKRLLIVERGWYDMAIDPRRYRLPARLVPLVTWAGRLVPKADVTVLLSGDPTAFHARKPEIGSDEVLRQLREWQHMAPRTGRRMIELDTVHDTVEDCAAALSTALPGLPQWRRAPIAPKRLQLCATGASPALDIYRPHRLPARVAARINGPLFRLGLAPVTSPPPLPDLSALIGQGRAGRQQLAALRSSAPDRWVVAAADEKGIHTVVKVGPVDSGLEREIAALRRLKSTTTLSLPVVVGELHESGWHAIATGAVRNTEEPPELDEVVDLATALARGDLGLPVVHGDLAPWNLSRDERGVMVWDWEESELGVTRPLHDLTHYLIRAGTLLGIYSPREVAQLLTTSGGPGVRHLEALGLPPESAVTHIHAYLARTESASAPEQDFRTRLATELNTRST